MVWEDGGRKAPSYPISRVFSTTPSRTTFGFCQTTVLARTDFGGLLDANAMQSFKMDSSLEGFAAIEPGEGKLERVAITSPLAEAHIYLHGAHVTHFQPRGYEPLLFLSRESLFKSGKAIRGGVPLVFPWFGPNAADPKLPAHGFARTTAWNLESISRDGDLAIVELSLKPSDLTRKLWPHEFELRYRVTIGLTLQLELAVRNVDDDAWRFEEAFHTYLAVPDVRKLSIAGLAGRDYLDKVQGGRRIAQGRESITITGETDRVYLNTRDEVVIAGLPGSRRFRVSKDSSHDTVVWNPWIAKAKAMADFGDEEWPAMLCIESANVGENSVDLSPGATHVMKTKISVE